MLMVKAGEVVDHFINDLVPLLEKDDIIIDGGNSLYTDSNRRTKALVSLFLFIISTVFSHFLVHILMYDYRKRRESFSLVLVCLVVRREPSRVPQLCQEVPTRYSLLLYTPYFFIFPYYDQHRLGRLSNLSSKQSLPRLLMAPHAATG
jgi:hypothetical protein